MCLFRLIDIYSRSAYCCNSTNNCKSMGPTNFSGENTAIFWQTQKMVSKLIIDANKPTEIDMNKWHKHNTNKNMQTLNNNYWIAFHRLQCVGAHRFGEHPDELGTNCSKHRLIETKLFCISIREILWFPGEGRKRQQAGRHQLSKGWNIVSSRIGVLLHFSFYSQSSLYINLI